MGIMVWDPFLGRKVDSDQIDTLREEYANNYQLPSAIAPIQFDMSKFGTGGSQPNFNYDAATQYGVPNGVMAAPNLSLNTLGNSRNLTLGLENKYGPDIAHPADNVTPANEQLGSVVSPQPMPSAVAPLQTNYSNSGTAEAVTAASAAVNAGVAAAKLAGVGAGAAASMGLLATLGTVVPIIGAVGGLVALGVSWYYTSKQKKEEERVNRENERLAAEAAAEEKRRWEINLELTQDQIREQNRQARQAEALARGKQRHTEETDREELTMKKEDRAETARQNRINQAISLLMGTMQLFNSPANREQNYNFWAQRAAATK